MTNLIEQDLESLRALGPNWDGYHAPVIDPITIEAAKSLAAKFPDGLDRQTGIIPTPDGFLQFEWHDGKRSLELEFDSPSSIYYLYWDLPRIEEGVLIVEDTESILALIRRFFGLGSPNT